MRRWWLAAAGIAILAACTDGSSATGGLAAAGPLAVAEDDVTDGAVAAPAPPDGASHTAIAQVPRRPVVLGFGGDVSFTHGLDRRDPFGAIGDLLSAPDVTVVNLETVLAEPGVGRPADKRHVFRSPPQAAGLLAAAGIDAVALGNNHVLDYGRAGVLRTLEVLDGAGIAAVGAGADPAAAYAPRWLEAGPLRIALVSLSRVPCDWSRGGINTRPEVAWACDAFAGRAEAAIEQAAGGADLVVVLVHWGVERERCPRQVERELAATWIDRGADLIVGSHPHVLQGVERIGDGWIVYSTGNFAFPSARGPTAATAFFEFTVTNDDVSLRAIPLESSEGRPVRVDATASRRILDDLTRRSFSVAFDARGVARAAEEPARCR